MLDQQLSMLPAYISLGKTISVYRITLGNAIFVKNTTIVAKMLEMQA